MTEIRVSVRREPSPRFSLFGPERWWGVYLTPFQEVASFQHFYDAMTWAAMIVATVRQKTETREGTK